MVQLPPFIATDGSDDSLVRWLLGGIGAAIVGGAAALWKHTIGSQKEAINTLTTRINALEAKVDELEDQNETYRHENATTRTLLAVAQAKLDILSTLIDSNAPVTKDIFDSILSGNDQRILGPLKARVDAMVR